MEVVKRYPTEQRTAKDLLKSIPKRFMELIIKLFSVKGVVLGLGTWLVFNGKIGGWIWLITAAIVIGGKVMKLIIDKAKGE